MKLQDSHSSIRLLAYLDDVFMLGESEKVLSALDKFKSSFREVGLVVAEHKCEIYSPCHSVCQSIPISSDGVITLGTPIGSASFVVEASLKIAREGEKLTTFNDLQSAVLLLRHFHVSRLHHLARVIPPDTLHQAATKHFVICCLAQLVEIVASYALCWLDGEM